MSTPMLGFCQLLEGGIALAHFGAVVIHSYADSLEVQQRKNRGLDCSLYKSSGSHTYGKRPKVRIKKAVQNDANENAGSELFQSISM